MVILYCDRCGQRITAAEQQSGQVQIDAEGVAICAKCAAAPPPRRSTQNVTVGEARREPTGPARRPSPAPQAERSARHTGRSAPAVGTPSSNKMIMIAVGVVVALAVGITVVLLSSGRDSAGNMQASNASSNAAATAQPATVSGAAPPVSPKELAAYPLPQGNRPASSQPATPAPPAPTPGAPALSPAAAPATPAKQEDTYDPRSEVAASMLAQAQAFNKANPDDVWAYRDKLDQIKERYAGTQGGKEAARLLSEIKLPEVDPATNPAPPAETAWANAVQVLPLTDPAKGRQNGNWSMTGGVLRSDKSMWARLALPYLLPEEYDLRLTFVRTESDDCLLVVLARRGRPFIFSIAGANNMGCSFETIKERRRDVLPTKISRPGMLANNQRYQLVIQVRNKCLRAHLNGKPVVGCQVDDEGLSLAPELTTPRPNQLGLATWNSVYEFHSLEVLPLTGEGKMLK